MNSSKEIKTLIRKIILTTIFTIVITVIWSNISNTKAMQTKNYLAINNALTVTHNINNDYLYPMQDKEAITKLTKNIITVKNNNNTKTNYSLLLRIEKSSTLDLNVLKYEFNGEIGTLNNLYKEDTLYYYYNLSDLNINENGTSESTFIMWINEDAANIAQNKTLSYKIIATDNNALVLK